MAAMSAKLMVCGCGEKKPPTEPKTIYEYWRWNASIIFEHADASVKALIQAIESDDLDKITRLAEDGADINARGKMDITPLAWALLADDETFEKLLELGADPNIPVDLTMWKDYGWNSPHTFCYYISAGTVVNMLCNRIDFEVDGTNYPFRGILNDRPKLRAALEHGGDPNRIVFFNNTYYSPLMQVGSVLAVIKTGTRILLDAGADPNYAAPSGLTLLQEFLSAGEGNDNQIEAIEMLLDAGVDICAGDRGTDIVMSLVRWEASRTWNQTPLSDTFCRLRDQVIEKGVDYELAKETINTPGNRKNDLYRLPFNKRPWLPCYEPDEEEEPEAATD